MSRKFLNIILCLIVWLPIAALSQELPTNPPKDVIAAAVSAFGEYNNGQTLDDIIKSPNNHWDETMPGSSAGKPFVISRTFDTSPHGSICCERPKYPTPLIVRLASRSDLVGTGVPIKEWSYPTADKSFAVSIYLVRLTTITIAAKESLPADRLIYVARAGGPFIYDGKYFQAIETDFPAFDLNQPYLFFAQQIAPDLYKADATGTLKVEGSYVVEMSSKHPNAEYFRRNILDAIVNESLLAFHQR